MFSVLANGMWWWPFPLLWLVVVEVEVMVVVRLDSSSRETSVGIEPVLRSFRDRYLPGVESMLVMVRLSFVENVRDDEILAMIDLRL